VRRCGWFVDEEDAKELGLAVDDGWIRSPDDVLPRLMECNHRAAINPYLTEFRPAGLRPVRAGRG
jgi:hypothetical protein